MSRLKPLGGAAQSDAQAGTAIRRESLRRTADRQRAKHLAQTTTNNRRDAGETVFKFIDRLCESAPPNLTKLSLEAAAFRNRLSGQRLEAVSEPRRALLVERDQDLAGRGRVYRPTRADVS